MGVMNKHEMRDYLRSLYEGENARNEQSSRLCQHILNSQEYRNARVIGGYMPMKREADVTMVLRRALLDGKMLVLPLCGAPPNMTFRQVKSLEELTRGHYGLLEPACGAKYVSMEQIDLLLVPLEGIDNDGFRLGKGGGYYDALLKKTEVMTIGCVLKWQIVDAVPRDAWDQPLKAMADECGIQYFETNTDDRKDICDGQEAED